MKRNQRRILSADFKARAALEAVMRLKPLNQIAAEYKLHPVQVSQWKKELISGASSIFERESKVKRRSEEHRRDRSKLELKMDQLSKELKKLVIKVQGAANVKVRKAMVESGGFLSVRRQSHLLGVNRNQLKSVSKKSDQRESSRSLTDH